MYNLIPFVHTFDTTIQRPKIFSRNPYSSLNIGNQLFLGGLNYGVDKAFDSSPFGRNGTLTNMVPATDCQPDPELGRHCIVGDGLTKYLSISPFKLGNSGTISMWVNYQEPVASTDGALMRISANVGGSPVRVFDVLNVVGGNTFTGWYNAGDDDRIQRVLGLLPLVQNVWSLVQLEWTLNGATTLRIDNNVVGTPTATTTAIWNTATIPSLFQVLRDPYFGGYNLAAKVADFCVWDRLLTESERKILLSKDPMLGGWLYDPTITQIPMVGLLPTSPPAAASPSLWMGVCI